MAKTAAYNRREPGTLAMGRAAGSTRPAGLPAYSGNGHSAFLWRVLANLLDSHGRGALSMLRAGLLAGQPGHIPLTRDSVRLSLSIWCAAGQLSGAAYPAV